MNCLKTGSQLFCRRLAGRWCAGAILVAILCACGGDSSSDASSPPNEIPSTGAANLNWNAPIADQDGGTLSGLAGYRIYYGKSPRSGNDPADCDDDCGYGYMTNVGNQTSATIEDLESGTWYFSVTAYDPSGNESPFSEEKSKTIP